VNKELKQRIISSIVLIPLVFFCILMGSYIFSLLIFISFLITLYEWNKMIQSKILVFLGSIYLLFAYLTVFMIRNNFGIDSVYYFFLIILICISTDIGGYIFGKIIKGPKLGFISPNKTYAGFIGGIIMTIIMVLLFVNFIYSFNIDKSKVNLVFLLFVFLISIVSQIGDLIISYFKRLSKIKDTGNIIPGHGGLLDRTDGMVFAFPFSYILLTLKVF
tara:strand:- start:1076 stop:1729 length:654 start_codon:yes stop_codon:yes gene_type:complete